VHLQLKKEPKTIEESKDQEKAVSDVAFADITNVPLWNPNAIGCWSFLFTPLFGSILTFMNWRALGKYEETKKAKRWIWISVLVLVAVAFVPPEAVVKSIPASEDFVPFGVAGIFLLTWYFFLGNPQAKYFKNNLGRYKKRGWGKPLGLALVGWVCYFFILSQLIITTPSALIEAARMGDTEKAQALLERGADVNARNNECVTALMAAAAEGHTDTVQALLEKGADVNAKNNDGKTALMRAKEKGHKEIVRMLKEVGAKE